VRLLLDTHVWLWQGAGLKRLGSQTRALLEDRDNELYLSIVSIWELSIKVAAGKLRLPTDFKEFIETRLAKSEANLLNVSLVHTLALRELQRIHGDPFDRMLVCQARCESMTLVTADYRLLEYPVHAISAGN
jgi:PIN domain nuclease of toxin-antitoxin system